MRLAPRRRKHWLMAALVLVVLAVASWRSGMLARGWFFMQMNSPARLVEKIREDGLQDTVYNVLDKLLDPDSLPTLRYSMRDGSDQALVESAIERARLPPFKTIVAAPTAQLKPASGLSPNHAQWTRSHGNDFSDKFSSLQQITPHNVDQLQPA
jgi:glucose dehydrogenase